MIDSCHKDLHSQSVCKNNLLRLRSYFVKSWRQHRSRHQLYGHLLPITKTIQVRRTRHAGHCWRRRDELISDVLLWTPTHGRAKAGQPARTYIQQLCEDTGCSPEDLPEVMNDREKWRERVRDIRAGGATWWWWWYQIRFNKTTHVVGLILHFYIMILLISSSNDTPKQTTHTLTHPWLSQIPRALSRLLPHNRPGLKKDTALIQPDLHVGRRERKRLLSWGTGENNKQYLTAWRL